MLNGDRKYSQKLH